jgi:hypothetical protein
MANTRRGREEEHDIKHALHQLQSSVDVIAQDVKTLLGNHPPKKSLDGFIKSVHGRRCTMPVNVPVPALLDVEKIVLSVMPRKADGHVDATAVITWVSSDASQVGAEPGTDPFTFHDPQFDEDVTCPGAFNCTATTPLDTGTGSVTASCPGYDSAAFGPISYAPGVARSLNASVGSPISDL